MRQDSENFKNALRIAMTKKIEKTYKARFSEDIIEEKKSEPLESEKTLQETFSSLDSHNCSSESLCSHNGEKEV